MAQLNDLLVLGNTHLIGKVSGVEPEKIGAYPSDTLLSRAVLTDYNTLTNGAWKVRSGSNNAPTAYAATVFHKDWDVNFATQMAFNNDTTISFRFKTGGTWHDWTSYFLPLSGGVLTGNVAIERNGLSSFWCRSSASNTNAMIGVERTDVNSKMALIIGSGGTQKGLWDYNINNSGENGWFCFTDGADCYFATSAKYNNVYLGSTNVYVNSAGVLYGAAWNDYAEYREQKEQIKPGYCAAAVNDGRLIKTSYRLQACDGIVSDTFGFAIGETEKCQTPLAVSGRVLAYFEGEREDYQAGDVVGAGPNGKVVKMTREEIKEYPDRIIGHVSEIPEYEVWGSGNVEVDGRIWIKVK